MFRLTFVEKIIQILKYILTIVDLIPQLLKYFVYVKLNNPQLFQIKNILPKNLNIYNKNKKNNNKEYLFFKINKNKIKPYF